MKYLITAAGGQDFGASASVGIPRQLLQSADQIFCW